MGQTMEHAKNDVIGGVTEQQLMQGGTQSADKEQNDGHKQAEKSGNATVPRKMGTQAGNGILKESEKMQISHEKEAGKNDGPEVSQLQPNKKNKPSAGVGTADARRDGSYGSKQHGDIGGGWWPAPPKTMNILSWNVQGLGNPRAFQALRKILQLHGAQLVFLCETKVSTMQMNVIASKLSFENCLAVNGVYGHPEISQKKHTWTLLRWLAVLSSSPWLCCGDFNEILHPDEKRGGNDRNVNLINEFREVLRDCGLKDVGFRGYAFTWNNGRYGEGFVEERLDIFVCSKAWSDRFVDCAAGNLDSWTSDHCPVLMVVQERREAEEVLEALSQMCPTKAPGLDGLPAVFYQKHWHTVKEGVLTSCLHILNSQGTIGPLNHTYIALIPKIGKPRKVTDFRPISLCNVSYRIVAKTVANRFKQVLHKIISPSQSGFIPNRLITDNIIVGYECLHKIRHCKSKRNGLIALKLDVSKAYDRLEWNFLEQTLEKLGFSQQWISLIMRCISSVSFSVLINSAVKGLIKPQRGLRQGCPLSPYLFITCAEAFSSLLQQAEQQQLIHGLSFGSNLKISHLLFADDSLLNIVSRHEKYLGLPSMIGRKRSSFFNDIKLKVANKLSSWQHKFFSCGGKEVLIKAAVQAISAYAMSVFKIPGGVCDDIQKMVAKFWWRVGNGQKIHVHKANWIPRASTFQPIVKPSLSLDAMVSELITEANCWDEKRIYKHFDQMDADLIAKIPLPRSPREDELIWHYGKNGQFSIRIFAWRAAKNQLPSAENLWRKKIIQDPTCQVCKMGTENVFHALVACKSAEKVWKLIHFDDDIRAAHSQDILSILHAMKRMRNRDDLELLVTIFWVKWNARNQMIFKGKRETPQIMVAKAEALIAAYKRVHSPDEACSETEQKAPPQKWNPPQAAAAIKVAKFHGDVSYAEAEAMEWGMLVAREANMKAVIMESDSQGVVNLVNNKQGSRSEIYWVVSEIQNLTESFERVSFKYTTRSCNVIAHSLAKLALEKCENVVWKGSYPSQVMYLFSSLV
ncbi:reverse transcriptase domain-containing protein [Citrus sinensis]|nr:reverse transcriptase domain-containing protein [Citrus sinensis]